MSKGITQADAIEMRHFSGFPGIYGPGIVVPLADTGMTEAEAAKRIKSERLPLQIVEVKEAEPAEKQPPAKSEKKGGE